MILIEWLFVDDSGEERAAFANALTVADDLLITGISATDAKALLNANALRPTGVLMDVDLSNETGMQSTGPGLSQDMRVAQQRQDIPSFPIVRFSYRTKVEQNIGHDTSSDDLFDLKIDKDGVAAATLDAVRSKLRGVAAVYSAVGESVSASGVLGLNEEIWEAWGHPTFAEDLAIADRTYLRAMPLVRALMHPGFLINEDLLAIRLGLDRHASSGWAAVLAELEQAKYQGVAAQYFQRWWARGLEAWWAELGGDCTPLAGNSIGERFARLSDRFSQLVALSMPTGSWGDRPWRHCSLTLEHTGEFLPLDPARSVRFKSRSKLPDWLDPLYAALGPAVRAAGDARLDKDDLERLSLLARKTPT
ncbi:MAG TPA: hypothetical protein VK614_15455 [Allosphingosinicella sp.]|nr:hypothetical protein [Allosphingosinicella sp.]